MLILGLVHDHGWGPDGSEPPEEPAPRRAHSWHLPWRPLAWLAVWCWLMALVPVANQAFGALAGFGLVIAAVVLACWRIDRWCSRQYWHGLREHKS